MEFRYWDTDAFLGYLKVEADKIRETEAVIKEAEAGNIRLVTSALTLTEVIKLRKHSPIDRSQSQSIKDFFKHEYISVRNVDRRIAEEARELVWDYPPLKPKDCIHVATALRFSIPCLETFDGDLIKLDGTIGAPPLHIRRPMIVQQALELDGID